MPSNDEANSAKSAVTEQSSQHEDAAQQAHAPPYKAPYIQHDNPTPGLYLVAFQPGYTLAKHFAFLGREFEAHDVTNGNGDESLGYTAEMDDELLELIRTDPMVQCVDEDSTGYGDGIPIDSERSAQPTSSTTAEAPSVYKAPHYRYDEVVPGTYQVGCRKDHTLAKHFAFLGCKPDAHDVSFRDESLGYIAEMDDELVELVRSDPGIGHVEDGALRYGDAGSIHSERL